MVSLEGTLRSIDAPSSPRISFSAEFSDESNFICITPKSHYERDTEKQNERATMNNNNNNAEFEFLSSNNNTLLTADELFFEGKLLPFWQMQHSEKFQKISLNAKEDEEDDDDEDDEKEVKMKKKEEETRVNWFVDEDPSPRPPKCTVLWKELLKLKKQRASSSSSSSSVVSVLSPSSSSSSSSSSLSDMASKEEGRREKHVKRVKKGLERTRSASIRIRPMINVPICTQVKSNPLPPLFALKKGR